MITATRPPSDPGPLDEETGHQSSRQQEGKWDDHAHMRVSCALLMNSHSKEVPWDIRVADG